MQMSGVEVKSAAVQMCLISWLFRETDKKTNKVYSLLTQFLGAGSEDKENSVIIKKLIVASLSCVFYGLFPSLWEYRRVRTWLSLGCGNLTWDGIGCHIAPGPQDILSDLCLWTRPREERLTLRWAHGFI